MKKKTIRMSDNLENQLKKMSEQQSMSETIIIEKALKTYFDFCFVNENQNMVNEEILKIIDAKNKVLEDRINNKTNQLLSELAINVNVLTQVLADNLELEKDDLQHKRKQAVEFIKINQRILKLSEMV